MHDKAKEMMFKDKHPEKSRDRGNSSCTSHRRTSSSAFVIYKMVHAYPFLVAENYSYYQNRFCYLLPDNFETYCDLPVEESFDLEMIVAHLADQDDGLPPPPNGAQMEYYLLFRSIMTNSFIFFFLSANRR